MKVRRAGSEQPRTGIQSTVGHVYVAAHAAGSVNDSALIVQWQTLVSMLGSLWYQGVGSV